MSDVEDTIEQEEEEQDEVNGEEEDVDGDMENEGEEDGGEEGDEEAEDGDEQMDTDAKEDGDQKMDDSTEDKKEEILEICVGNLPKNVDIAKLKKFFMDNLIETGKIRRYKQRDFAYLDLVQAADLEKALALDGEEFEDQKITVTKGREAQEKVVKEKPVVETPQEKAKKILLEIRQRTVSVGDFGADALADELLTPLLEECDSFKTRFRGKKNEAKNGHIEMQFTSVEEADKAVAALEGKKIGETELKVKKLDADNLPRGVGTYAAIFINDIPNETTTEMIREIFQEATKIHLPLKEEGTPEGYAVVEFDNLDVARDVVNTHKDVQIGEQTLTIHILSLHKYESRDPAKGRFYGPYGTPRGGGRGGRGGYDSRTPTKRGGYEGGRGGGRGGYQNNYQNDQKRRRSFGRDEQPRGGNYRDNYQAKRGRMGQEDNNIQGMVNAAVGQQLMAALGNMGGSSSSLMGSSSGNTGYGGGYGGGYSSAGSGYSGGYSNSGSGYGGSSGYGGGSGYSGGSGYGGSGGGGNRFGSGGGGGRGRGRGNKRY